jgi:hypothetical protein
MRNTSPVETKMKPINYRAIHSMVNYFETRERRMTEKGQEEFCFYDHLLYASFKGENH